jgi:hypothetical protein
LRSDLLFLFSLGEDHFNPSTERLIPRCCLSYVFILFSFLLFHAANMTLTNGDANASSVPLLRGKKPLDYTKALEVLETEYPDKDGLDVYTLLDTTKNGALTYNDFLVLPGYIGMATSFVLVRALLTALSQVSPRRRSRSIHR